MPEETAMYIVALAWIYVVFMMSITENSVVAGIMTFLLYGIVPVSIILYVMGTPQRKRKRKEAEKVMQDSTAQTSEISAEKENPTGTK